MGCSIVAVQPHGLHVNMKKMKALWLVLSSFLVLYLPAFTVSQIVLFTHPPYPLHLLITQDVCNVKVFLNNIINPFLYYITVNEFRTGYKDLLSCRKRVENAIV